MVALNVVDMVFAVDWLRSWLSTNTAPPHHGESTNPARRGLALDLALGLSLGLARAPSVRQ